MSITSMRRCVSVVTAALGLVAATAVTAGAVGVDPASYSQSADPGDVITLTKTVSTPEIPPKPDIVLLADRTGSMGGAIGNVKANMTDIVNTVKAAQPDAQFAVASYCDFGEPNPFLLHSGLSGDTPTVTSAVNGITLCGGGDEPEAQLNALWAIGSGGNAVAFRPDSTRIVVWFGDAPGHDPSGGHTEAAATTSLQGVDARVLAVSVGFNRLDLTGQATRITTATGGSLMSGVSSGDLSAAILSGLSNLPVTVSGSPVCDPGLSASLSPASQTVTSGTNAVFTETITVDPGATQGATLGCEVTFSLNGTAGGPGFVQTVSIAVNDVTAPTVSCDPSVNPAGHEPAAANQDGFYEINAADNVDTDVDLYITDDASSASFGSYDSGTTFKLTQAPGATPSTKAGTGEVDHKVKLRGDAIIVAVDDAGNVATATCLVPPPPM